MSSFSDDAWSRITKPEALLKRYLAEAKRDDALALALARYQEEDDPHAKLALQNDGRELIAPLVTSRIFGENLCWATNDLIAYGTSRTAEVARDRLPKAAEPERQEALSTTLAFLGTPDDFAAVRKAAKGSPRVLFELARRGDSASRERVHQLATELGRRQKSGAGRTSSSQWPGNFELVEALATFATTNHVPTLLELIETPCVLQALDALAPLRDERSRAPAQQVLAESLETDQRFWVYRLAAQAALAQLGEKHGVTEARALLDRLSPQKYRWPKRRSFWRHQRRALHALHTRGTKADRERALEWAWAEQPELRTEGQAAATALGRTIEVRPYDAPLVRHLHKREGLGALKRLLRDPSVALDYTIARELAESDDSGAQKLACEWAHEVVERKHPRAVAYADPEQGDQTLETALQILEDLKSKPAFKKRIAASPSAWVQQRLFENNPKPAEPAPVKSALSATVRRVDHAPFVFGAKINGLALDREAKRLAVVMGDALSVIVDANTGALLATLEGLYRWPFDAAFSPDGKQLAVAYHGGHLVFFNATTGRKLSELTGFSGVPRAVRKLAYSPDGKFIAGSSDDGSFRLFNVKTQKQVWKLERRSSWEAVLFSADSATCFFTEVNSADRGVDTLFALDLRKLKAKSTPMPFSIWALALGPDGELWAGGEGKEILHLDAKRRLLKPLKQAGVVRLAWSHDRARLIAASQTGKVKRWDVGTGKSQEVRKTGSALWGMAVGPQGTFVGGNDGTVYRFDAQGAPFAGLGGEVHTEQVRGFVFAPDGAMITAGWDGRLLRWRKGAAQAELLVKRDERLTELCLSADGKRVFAGSAKALVEHSLETAQTREVKLKDWVEGLAVGHGQVVVGLDNGEVEAFDEATLQPLWSKKVTAEVSSLAMTADGAVLVGSGAGGLIELTPGGEVAWSKAEHGVDLIDKDPLGSPHRDVVGLDACGEHFASLSNDDTLRLFKRASKARLLRADVDGGLFNNCRFSPSGRWLATTKSWGLHVFEVASGKPLCEVNLSAFPGATQLSVLAFRDETTLMVGTTAGPIFEVKLTR